MREELGRVNMNVGMIKKLEKSDIPSPDNIGFLSHEQLQEVEAKKTPAGRMNKVIDYLVEMEDIHFENFCKILRGGFEAKVTLLKDKAKDLKRIVGKFEYKQHRCMCSNIIQRLVACKLRNVNWLMMSHPDYCLDCVNSYLFYGETHSQALQLPFLGSTCQYRSRKRFSTKLQ